MKDTILSIAGKPGLYRLASRGRGMVIVESLQAPSKRFPASPRDRVTSLNDVSMYTDGDEKPLMEIFQTIYDNQAGAPLSFDHKKADEPTLRAFMESALPTYDRDRVYLTDIRKLAQWYNALVAAGYTDFAGEEPAEGAEAAE